MREIKHKSTQRFQEGRVEGTKHNITTALIWFEGGGNTTTQQYRFMKHTHNHSHKQHINVKKSNKREQQKHTRHQETTKARKQKTRNRPSNWKYNKIARQTDRQLFSLFTCMQRDLELYFLFFNNFLIFLVYSIKLAQMFSLHFLYTHFTAYSLFVLTHTLFHLRFIRY